MAQKKLPAKHLHESEQMESNLVSASNSIIPNGTVLRVMAYTRCGREPVRTTITINELIGKGTFGRVYKAQLDQSERLVALKQVDFDPYILEREPKIMNYLVGHCNIVRLIMYCYARLGHARQNYLLLAMEYMPMTLAEFILQQRERPLQSIYVRVISYQLFRGLGYLHSHFICHRDIKPENTLLDPLTMNLKLSDFGSAKFLQANESSATYVCSRFYRAPELFAKCEIYDTSVDLWSAGCVLAELLKGAPLFASSKHDQAQLLHVIGLLGTAGLERAPRVLAASGLDAATVSARPSWQTLIGNWVPEDLAALLDDCLQYEAAARISPLRACAHASYDELRTMDALNIQMPNGVRLPPLFNFSAHELQVEPGLWMHLLPLHLSQSLVEAIEQ
ncbi:glycogen synthase kinase-3 alpha-like isoform X2 [Drosophila montana]|uniref:glycogen synthase kinase-3 alpha-like isoform X2 n=1 Tax=Drosophila montana TaxID=40370 RepID=UPI00313D27CD